MRQTDEPKKVDRPSSEEEQPTLFRRWFPPMVREDRQELLARIELGAEGGRDYVVMMILAATLASLGLLQGSTAVVIGAMLVAPLMGPLLGAGLALVQGNLVLMRRSMSVAAIGIGLGLAVATFFGAINPGYEPTMEVESRGTPDILDLFVALTSGMIAAYGQSRSHLANTLAGVAIAAALLPPLAAVGIAATLAEYEIAIFAAVLLTTNVVAIIMGAALVFRVIGFQVKRSESHTRPWVRVVLVTLSAASVALAGPLLLRGIERDRSGQNRPASYPVSVPVRKAVKVYLKDYPDIQLISMARLSVEPESGITIVLSSYEPLAAGFRRGLRNAVRTTLGEPLLEDLLNEAAERVRIYVMLEAPYDPDPDPVVEAEEEIEVIELVEPPVDRRIDDAGAGQFEEPVE